MKGKEVRPLQLRHVPSPLVIPPRFPVAEEKLKAGKDVREEQLFQVSLKLWQLPVLIFGKLVRLEQSFHARSSEVALLVSISGKLVNPLQPSHAPVCGFTSPKRVTLAVLIAGKLVKLVQYAHAPANVIAELKSSKGNDPS